MGSSPGIGHRFKLRLRPRCHQCLWIRLTAANMWGKMAQLPCHIYTLIQCTPLLVEKAGVALYETIGITTHKQERVKARDPLRIWNLWARTHEVQNRSNQWLHKLGLGPTKILKKKIHSSHVIPEKFVRIFWLPAKSINIHFLYLSCPLLFLDWKYWLFPEIWK